MPNVGWDAILVYILIDALNWYSLGSIPRASHNCFMREWVDGCVFTLITLPLGVADTTFVGIGFLLRIVYVLSADRGSWTTPNESLYTFYRQIVVGYLRIVCDK
jgi:hypothetical protein